MEKIKTLSLNLMSFLYFAAGVNHFVNTPTYLKMMPDYLPAHGPLVYISGAIEMFLGLMLLNKKLRSLAAWGVILLLIAVFPANVYMYQLGGESFGIPDWVLLARLPAQLILIGWAYWHTSNPEFDQRIIETRVEIQAPVEKVWHELTHFSKYPEWNPFIVQAEGTFQPGTKSEVTIHPPGGVPMKFRQTVIEKSSNKRLSWRGSFLFGGLFDGVHYFEMKSLGTGKTELIHGEMFSGALIPLMSDLLKDTEQGFVLMNEALKSRAEKV